MMNPAIPYLGEGLSLLTASIWAFAVVLFRKSGETVHPLALNLFKNTLAIIILIPTMWAFGTAMFRQMPPHVYLILFLSGAIGIGIGDTIFFSSLNLLGAGLTGIVVCMYSPFIITFSHIWLGERLTMVQFIGAFLIICAVLITTFERRSVKIESTKFLLGIIFGVTASAAMALGIVIIKPMLNYLPVIWVAEMRLFGGMVTLALIFLFYPTRRSIIDSLIKTKSWGYTISGSFLGAYLSMVLWLAGMKYTQASIASALNQTSTIFIFIFAGLILKEPMNLRRTLGIALAFLGAFLVSFS